MGFVAMGGQNKMFYRIFTGSGQYAPDSSTLGARDADSDTGLPAINTELDDVTQASGEGFIPPPGQPVEIRFHGWTDATCVIQRWNPFFNSGAGQWETIFTWPSSGNTPLVSQAFTFYSPRAIRVGASDIGSDANNLAVEIDFAQSDRFGGF